MTKTCFKCLVDKPIDDFYSHLSPAFTVTQPTVSKLIMKTTPNRSMSDGSASRVIESKNTVKQLSPRLKRVLDEMVQRRMNNTGEDRTTAAQHIANYLSRP